MDNQTQEKLAYFLQQDRRFEKDNIVFKVDGLNHLPSLLLATAILESLEVKIDHSIDVQYEKDITKAFNKFIKKWCGKYFSHLIDTDENDGQFIRDKLEVELPEKKVTGLTYETAYWNGYTGEEFGKVNGYNQARDEAIKALKAQGVRVR